MRALVVLVGLVLVAAAFAAGGAATGDGATVAQSEPANAMSVDAVSGGAIDASRTVTTNDPFDVDIYIQHGGSESLDYSAYDAVLCFDSSVLDFVPTADLDRDTIAESWTYTDLGEMRGHLGVLEGEVGCPVEFVQRRLYGGSFRSIGETSASGVAATLAFRCIGSGTTTVHLVTQAEYGGIFAATSGSTPTSSWFTLPTTLADAEITCSPPPTPTACPADVCTPTATPSPVPTPTPTPTPDPSAQPNLMSVDAVSGGAINATRQLPVGSEFDVDIYIQHGGSSLGYVSYQVSLCSDSRILDFLPTQDFDGDTVLESWTYTDLGGMFYQGETIRRPITCPVPLLDTWLFGGALRPTGTTDASGAALTAHFACVAQGATTLHLLTEDEDDPFRSATIDDGSYFQPTELADATITCLPDTDGDRCGDRHELTTGFNPMDPSDFFSVPVPVQPDAHPNGPKDAAVTMQDVVAVLDYVGTFEGDGGATNAKGVAYDTVKGSCPQPFTGTPEEEGLCYDRSPGLAPNPPHEVGPADGVVNLQDVVLVLRQVGLDCTEPP